jgi:hypothetical protein
MDHQHEHQQQYSITPIPPQHKRATTAVGNLERKPFHQSDVNLSYVVGTFRIAASMDSRTSLATTFGQTSKLGVLATCSSSYQNDSRLQ